MPYKPTPFDPTLVNDQSPLVLKQQLFAYCLGRLLSWVYTDLVGVRLVLSEGHVAITDAKDGDYDGPHRRNGAHYQKRGVDCDLFINCTYERPQGDYVSAGGHPIWRMIGEKWKTYHSLCRWGGDFQSKDDNHISIVHGGVA